MEGRVVVRDNEDTAAAAAAATPAANATTTTTTITTTSAPAAPAAAAAAAAVEVEVEDSSKAVREHSGLDKSWVEALQVDPTFLRLDANLGVVVAPWVDSDSGSDSFVAGKPDVVVPHEGGGGDPAPALAPAPAPALALLDGTPGVDGASLVDSSDAGTLGVDVEPRGPAEMLAVAAKEPAGTPEHLVSSNNTDVAEQAQVVADGETVLLPQRAGTENPVVPVVEKTPDISADEEEDISTRVSETPSVEKESAVVMEERSVEPRVPAEVVVDRETVVLPQETVAENQVVPVVEKTPGNLAVEEDISTHVPETPSVEKESAVVTEERSVEPRVPAEPAVASEEPVGTLEHPASNDETDVVKQAEVIADRETALPQEADAENTVEKTPSISLVEEVVPTHVQETPSVEKEAVVVAGEQSAEHRVPAELAVASEELVGILEHPASNDETDVVEQAEAVVHQETVLSREADVVPVVEKTPGPSALEEAVSTHVPESPSVEKAVLVEQVQSVPPVEEGTHNSVETSVEAAVEKPVSAPVEEPVSAPVKEPVSAPVNEPVSAPVKEKVSAPVAEELARHEEIQTPVEGSAQTKQAEIVPGLEDKVELPSSSTLEGAAPAPISDAALAEKEQAQTDAHAEEHIPTKPVEAAVEEVDLVPTAETAVAEHKETLPVVEHPATSDVSVTPFVNVNDVNESARPRPQETDVIKQAEVVVDQETVLPREADTENPVVPIVEKTPGSSIVEEAVSTHVPEIPSVEKAVLDEQVQGVPPVEEGTYNSVEAAVEEPVSAPVEEPVSAPVAEELGRHEGIPVEESSQTKQAEITAGLEDKVELPSSSSLEGAAPAPISDAALAEKEQVQTDELVEDAPTKTVEAAVEEGDLVSTAETAVAKHEETLPVVEENKHFEEVTTAKDHVEPPTDTKSADECTIATAATSVEMMTAEPAGIIPPVATSAAAQETSAEEPTVEAVIAVPSVAEPTNVAPPVTTITTAEETSTEKPTVEAVIATPSVTEPTKVTSAEEISAEEPAAEAVIAIPSVAQPTNVALPVTTVLAEETSTEEPTVEAVIAIPSVAEPTKVIPPVSTIATSRETSTEEQTVDAVLATPSVADVATVATAEEKSAEEPTVEAAPAIPSVAEPTNVTPPVITTAEETSTEESTVEAVIVPSVAEPSNPPVATIVTAEETSTEEPILTQEEVDAVIATIPSVSEPADLAETETEAANASKSVVKVYGETNHEFKESTEESNALPVEVQIEQHKSPWTPSSQVISPDEQLTEPSATEPVVDSLMETKTEIVKTEELHAAEKLPAPVPVTGDVEEISKDVEQPLISTPQLVIDKSVLVEQAEAEKLIEEPIQEHMLPVIADVEEVSKNVEQPLISTPQLTANDSLLVAEAEESYKGPVQEPSVPVTASAEEVSKDVEQPLISTPQLVIDESLLVEPAEAEKSIEEPAREPLVPVTADVEDIPKDVEQPLISTPQLVIDKPLFVEPAEVEEPPIPVTAGVEKVSKDVEQPVISTPQLVINQSLLVEPAEGGKSSEVPIQEPPITVTADVEEVLKDVEPPVISTPQLVIDQSLLVEPAEAEKSYEGPVQESPVLVTAETEEVSKGVEQSVPQLVDDRSLHVEPAEAEKLYEGPAHESPISGAADVEGISKGVISTPQLVSNDSLPVEPVETKKAVEELVQEPLVPVTADVEDIPKDVEQTLISTPQLVIDQSLLVEPVEAEKISEGPVQEPSTLLYSTNFQGSSNPYNVELETDAPEPSARPWTPSYSVHSQGSPLSTHASLVQGSTPQKEEPLVANEDEAVDLEEIKFADKEAAPLGQQAQSQEVPANAFSETREEPAEVAPPCITVVETEHRLDATVASAPATFDSAHPEVRLTEATAANLEQNSQVHVPQVEDVNSNLAEAAMPVTGIEVPRLVLDSSKEVSAPSVAASEQVLEGKAPDVEERPASPWVPSYSVVVQGSPAQERPNPLDKEAVATTVLGASKDVGLELPVVDAPTVLTNHVVEAESRDHETSSVEISKDEVVTKLTEEAPEDSTVKAISVVSTSLVDDDQVEEVPMAATIAPESLGYPENMNQELTKSPRASSQPSTTPEISAELNKLSPAPLDQHTNDSQRDVVFEDASNDKKPDAVLTTATKPSSENMEVNPVREVFPTTEQSVVEQLNEPKTSGLRLSTSDANTATNGSSTSLDTISPAADRSRLESTSSSRFFPGGWFSPSKTVDESRPFFEVVQGEFTAQKVAAARDPSIDEGPSAAEQYTQTEGEANKPTSNKEQKSRWCVIM